MSTVADQIRQFAVDHYIEPARQTGTTQVAIPAGDVHKAMALKDRMPGVASALGSKMFEAVARVDRVSSTGPHNGANLVLTFKVHP